MRSRADGAGPPRVSTSGTNRENASTESVGRVGGLTLRYVLNGTRTVFARTKAQTPWHLLPPIYLDDSGAAYTLLLNPSGGLVGGDRLAIDMHLAPSAHVLISTPSANRVYRSPTEEAVQDIDVHLGAGAKLEWFPEHTIPFAGSRFRQSINVTLASGATVLLWDAIASGRIASGERWAFSSLNNEIRITTASGSSLLERYHLAPAKKSGAVGLASKWDYVASLFIVGDGIADALWNVLEAEISSILDERPGHLLGGVSRPALPGLAIKLVARSAPDLTAVCNALWAAVRRVVWGLLPPALRKH